MGHLSKLAGAVFCLSLCCILILPGNTAQAQLYHVKSWEERMADMRREDAERERKEKQRREQEARIRQEREDKLQQYATDMLVRIGGYESLHGWPQWHAENQWSSSSHNDRMGRYDMSARANGLIVAPGLTILRFEFKIRFWTTVASITERLEYWWSRGAYIDIGSVQLPFVGIWSQNKFNWLTNADGSVSHWGWDKPERDQIYSVYLFFAGGLPPDTTSISLREVQSGDTATGYTFGYLPISPPEQGRKYTGLSEPMLRGKILRNRDPIEGIYEDSGRSSFRLGVFKDETGRYSVVHLDNGKHRWWKDGEVKATLHPTATRGLFKADWTAETFYKNPSAIATFDGATMKVLGNELPMDDGSGEMVFVKMFPAEADMAASELVSDLPEVFKLPVWGATNNWFHSEANHEWIRVNGLIAGPRETVVFLELQVDADRKRLEYFASRNACLKVGDVKLPFIGHWENNERLQINLNADGIPSGWGWSNPEKGKSYFYNMVFAGRFPADLNPGRYVPISLLDNQGSVHGYSLDGIMVSPPTKGRHLSGISEMNLRQRLFHGTDPIEGIYETVGRNALRLGVVRTNNGAYQVLYLENGKHRWWGEGEVKATLVPTSTIGAFKAEWTDELFCKNPSALVSFNGTLMEVLGNEMPLDEGVEKMAFAKMWPQSDGPRDDAGDGDGGPPVGTGSGFALKYGYLVTNFHVVDGATDIKVYRTGGDGEISSVGKVVYSDEESDIAILETEFRDEKVPYTISASEVGTGSEVFALGYPMTTTMGKEVKLTTGVISAVKGFKDDPALYQISAAIQPGNSGGPLFDKSGALVGIVVAKHVGAENVNYAIKSSRLVQLLKMKQYDRILPKGNTFFVRKLADKVSRFRNYVYRIECAMGGSLGDGGKSTVWYPKVLSPYIRKEQLQMGTYVWPSDLVVVRVVRGKAETMVEIGGKCLNGSWLKRNTYLQAGNRIFHLVRVEGLPNDKPKEKMPDDFVFRTFKAYFQPLPDEVTSVDFIEPANADEYTFTIKGISLVDE